jgi:hypothetical protein
MPHPALTRPALALALALGTLPALATHALAQDQQQPAAGAQPAAPEASPSHTAAAIDFLVSSGLTKGFEEMIPQFLDQVRLRYVGQRPEIAQTINDATMAVVPEFVKRRDDLNRELAKIYTARFTEDELKQMADFYRTPAGQKLAGQQSQVLQASVPVLQAWSRKLNTDMAARVKEEVGKKGQKL